ncbi:MAG: glycerate kinase [Methylomonas sp.]|nr:glycerate kinase [Methylomonas sp.]
MNPTAAMLRDDCFALFQTGIAAADPQAAIKTHLKMLDGRLQIGNERIGNWRKIHIVAFGKAAGAMASAARKLIAPALLAEPGLVVTTYDNASLIEGLEVIGAGHPLPDTRGLTAAKKIADRVNRAAKNELVLALISGGGSAMLPYPVDGVSLDDKVATTRLLLASGADIDQINCVRKHLSQIKGGGLARLAAPADLHALILSDVLGDDLSAIASGPTVADPTTFADAIAVLKQKEVLEQVPSAVKAYLEQGAKGLKAETAKPGDPVFNSVSQTLIGSNSVSLDAVIKSAEQLAYLPQIYSRRLCGEARQVAIDLVRHAKTLFERGLRQTTAVIAGGETTVTVLGKGKGGRNQEMALAFALAAERLGLPDAWAFLSGGTDGRDGPTEAAGGVVDSRTLSKIRAASMAPEAALENNDSYTALQAADDLIMTGATGTNVADLQILLLHPFPHKNPSGEHHV